MKTNLFRPTTLTFASSLLLLAIAAKADGTNTASFEQIIGRYAKGTWNTNILEYFKARGAAELGHPSGSGVQAYVRYVTGDGFSASAQDFAGGSHGKLTIFDASSGGPTPWYMNRICVPFNNTNYDKQYGGAHDMDVLTPPGTPITSIVSGTVSSVTHPTWGWQIGIKLDQPINHAPYFAYLHLGAVKPGLAVGRRVEIGDLIAYSGGANSEAQLDGKTNTPFGPQFINARSQSSRPQTGFALMRGPEYGVGAGWTKLPDPVLDPTPTLKEVQAKYRAANASYEINDQHGLLTYYYAHGGIATFGPPKDNEHPTADGTQQTFATAALTWNSASGIVTNTLSNPVK